MKLFELLYEIDKAILECVDLETGEILDSERLDALQMACEEKIDNLACLYKQLYAESAALKAEKDRLAQRERQKEAKAEWIKNYIASALNGRKHETTRNKISWRKSESVELVDVSAIPDEFKQTVKEIKIDKNEIKKAVKAGRQVHGIEIVIRNNIQIK